MYDFTKFKSKTKETQDWLSREFTNIRTGRATPTLLDSVRVESYGAMMSLVELGSISTEDARNLRIAPWDMSQVKAIEKAIVAANLGVGVAVDDKGLRISFPELTGERRAQIAKTAKQKLEEAKVRLRSHREDTLKDLQNKEKDGTLGKDDVARFKNELQKQVDTANKTLEEAFTKKEKEILS